MNKLSARLHLLQNSCPFFHISETFLFFSLNITLLGTFEMIRPSSQCTDRSTRIKCGAVHERRMSEISLTYEVVNELSVPTAQSMSFKLSRFILSKNPQTLFCVESNLQFCYFLLRFLSYSANRQYGLSLRPAGFVILTADCVFQDSTI